MKCSGASKDLVVAKAALRLKSEENYACKKEGGTNVSGFWEIIKYVWDFGER